MVCILPLVADASFYADGPRGLRRAMSNLLLLQGCGKSGAGHRAVFPPDALHRFFR